MKKLKLLTATSAIASLALAGAAFGHTAHASSASTIVTTKHTSLGTILVTSSGKTLYADTAGACTGGCLQVWPALAAKGTLVAKGKAKSADLGKAHGVVTYAGHALYTFASDSGGSTSGEGSNGFYVVSPSGSIIKHAPKSTSSSSSSSGW